ncbi:hypothetical protein JX266_003230 [Neoarthrinium moseri]|nr:hypothetical protein JX266_003230 [Neoarthrinium moseri]
MMPLTPPPLRLSDRRFLPSMVGLSSVRSSSGQSQPYQGDVTSPKHPEFYPANSKMLPMAEQRSTTSSSDFDQGHGRPAIVIRSSTSSEVSNLPTIMAPALRFDKPCFSTTGSIAVISPRTPPLSPARPQRPHDNPLAVLDLVTPVRSSMGALPPPPPSLLTVKMRLSSTSTPSLGSASTTVSPVSPLSPSQHNAKRSPVSPPPHPAEIGVAISRLQNNPAAGVILPSCSHELCDLTESPVRERREKWAGWGGVSKGSPGTAVPGRNRVNGNPKISGDTKGIVRSPLVMKELDLARLGGSY